MTGHTARSGAEILAQINPTLRTGTAHICMRPDLIAEWEVDNAELMAMQANDSTNTRLASGGVSAATKKQAQKVRDLEVQIEASDVAFDFQKLDKTRHSEICDEHPPREGNVLDYSVGYNRDAVDNTVVFESLIDPVFELCTQPGCKHDACGTWQALLKFLGPGEWEEMANVVREVHGAVTAGPKSVLASRILDRPAPASRRRARSE